MKEYYPNRINSVLEEIKKELYYAVKKHNEFNSAHEGYSIILEEMDELWDEIKHKEEFRNQERMREEVIQVAAMAVRFYLDLL